MGHLTQKARIKIIKAIKKRPILYDPNKNSRPYDRLRQIAWEEVATEVINKPWGNLNQKKQNQIVKQLKTKWNTMRNNYKKNKNHTILNLSNNTYLPHLAFLDGHANLTTDSIEDAINRNDQVISNMATTSKIANMPPNNNANEVNSNMATTSKTVNIPQNNNNNEVNSTMATTSKIANISESNNNEVNSNMATTSKIANISENNNDNEVNSNIVTTSKTANISQNNNSNDNEVDGNMATTTTTTAANILAILQLSNAEFLSSLLPFMEQLTDNLKVRLKIMEILETHRR